MTIEQQLVLPIMKNPDVIQQPQRFRLLVNKQTYDVVYGAPLPPPLPQFFDGPCFSRQVEDHAVVQMGDRPRHQSIEASEEEQEQEEQQTSTEPQTKRLRLRKQYRDQLISNEITEADLKEKGLSDSQIRPLKKAEPQPDKPRKPHRPHRPHRPHKRLPYLIRKQYRDQLMSSVITEADLKEKGLSDSQIRSLKKAEPQPRRPHKPHNPHKPHKPLPYLIRKQYRDQLISRVITEAYLKEKGLSDGQIRLLKKTEPQPRNQNKPLSYQIRKQYRDQLMSNVITEADLKEKGLSDSQIRPLIKAEPKPPKPHKPLAYLIRKQYRDQLMSSVITEADLKEKGLSDSQIRSLKKAEPQPRRPHKPHNPHKPHKPLPYLIRKIPSSTH